MRRIAAFTIMPPQLPCLALPDPQKTVEHLGYKEELVERLFSQVDEIK